MNFHLTLKEIQEAGVSSTSSKFPKSGRECNVVVIPKGVVEYFREEWKNSPSEGDVIQEILGRVNIMDGGDEWRRNHKKMKRVVACVTEYCYTYYIPTSLEAESEEEEVESVIGW